MKALIILFIAVLTAIALVIMGLFISDLIRIKIGKEPYLFERIDKKKTKK